MSAAPPTVVDFSILVEINERLKRLEDLTAARAAMPAHDPLEELSPKELAAHRGLSCADSITKALIAGRIRGTKRGGRWVVLRGDACTCPSCAAWRKANGR